MDSRSLFNCLTMLPETHFPPIILLLPWACCPSPSCLLSHDCRMIAALWPSCLHSRKERRNQWKLPSMPNPFYQESQIFPEMTTTDLLIHLIAQNKVTWWAPLPSGSWGGLDKEGMWAKIGGWELREVGEFLPYSSSCPFSALQFWKRPHPLRTTAPALLGAPLHGSSSLAFSGDGVGTACPCSWYLGALLIL